MDCQAARCCRDAASVQDFKETVGEDCSSLLVDRGKPQLAIGLDLVRSDRHGAARDERSTELCGQATKAPQIGRVD